MGSLSHTGKTEPFKRLLFPSHSLNNQRCMIWSPDAGTSRRGVGTAVLTWVWSLGTSLPDVCAACHARPGFGLQASLESCSRNMHEKRVSRPVSQSPGGQRRSGDVPPSGGSLSVLSFCARDLLPVFSLVGLQWPSPTNPYTECTRVYYTQTCMDTHLIYSYRFQYQSKGVCKHVCGSIGGICLFICMNGCVYM